MRGTSDWVFTILIPKIFKIILAIIVVILSPLILLVALILNIPVD